MTISLSDFLIKLRESDDYVLVTENQLRRFAKKHNELAELVSIQRAKITYLTSKINEAQAKKPDVVDLFA